MERYNLQTDGALTSTKLEQKLKQQYKSTIDGYEKFVTESHDDLFESQRVLDQMQSELNREAAITEQLE